MCEVSVMCKEWVLYKVWVMCEVWVWVNDDALFLVLPTASDH